MITTKITAKQQKQVAAIIAEVGRLTRQRIETLEPHIRDLAWATVSCGIVSAALHDCSYEGLEKVTSMVDAAFEMLPVLREEKQFQDAYDRMVRQ